MSITKQFFRYVSQNIFGMLGISCYIIADTFFIAKAAGARGITVLNLALPIYNLIFAIGSMIGVGSATQYTIRKARNDYDADHYFSNAIGFVVLFSMIGVVIGVVCPDQIMRLMGADEEIIRIGINYNRIFISFTPFFMLNYVVSAFIRNDNEPALAMIATLSSSIFNIVFDYLFMFPFHMGMSGAALATAISPIVSTLICSTHFLKKRNTIRFVWHMLSIKELFLSCKLGVSAFVGEVASGVTTTVFNFLILGLAGNVGVASYGVIANYALVAIAIFNGIAQGSQPLLSKYYGKGDCKAVSKVYKLGIVTAFILSSVLIGVVYAYTNQFVALFNSENSEEMAKLAFTGIRIYFIGFIFAAFNIVSVGYFSAIEQSNAAFVTSILRGVVAITVFSVLLAGLYGMNGIWSAFSVSEALTSIIIAIILTVNIEKKMKIS